MVSENEELTGVFEVDKTETDHLNTFPPETEFVRVEYGQNGYYKITSLDENKEELTDHTYDAYWAETDVMRPLKKDPEGKFSIFV